MKRLSKLFLLLSLLTPLFLSADSYIKITNTKSTKNLKNIKSKMKSMGLKPVHKTTKTSYVIYSGPYSNSQEASVDKRKISRYFPSAKIINYGSKTPKTPKTDKSNVTKSTQISSKKREAFHIGASVGYASARSTIGGDETHIQVFPETNGLSYNIEAGYTFFNGVDASLAYMVVDTSGLTYANSYASLNYKYFSSSDFTPFVGALVGYSSLTWNIIPVIDSSAPDSTSTIYGAQFGFLYNIGDSFAITTSYKGMVMDHIANINDDTGTVLATINHSLTHSIFIGLELSF